MEKGVCEVDWTCWALCLICENNKIDKTYSTISYYSWVHLNQNGFIPNMALFKVIFNSRLNPFFILVKLCHLNRNGLLPQYGLIQTDFEGTLS